jgi:uncharacterized protein (DUF433 family)
MVLQVKDKQPQPPLWKRRLYLPTYTLHDAARYAGTRLRTVSYWQHSTTRDGRALSRKVPRKPLSYLQLIEVAFVATCRRAGVSLQTVRKAREYAQQHLNEEYPFAAYRWKTEGTNLLLELREVEKNADINKMIVGNKWGQTTWKPMIGQRFKQFEYENDLVMTWYVWGKTAPIVIDPRIAFGAPTVNGLPTWVIKGRWVAGENKDEIKADFNIEGKYIEYALKFEGVSVN